MASKQILSSKRGPPAPLSSFSSSSEGEGSDHEDIPASPCSSTASGPTYERPPGFKFHGQEIVATKPRNVSTKCKKRVKRLPVENGSLPNGANRSEETLLPAASSKAKPKKDPLPMKLRALPQSFWQQPNSVTTMPPGNMYLPVLPPLFKSEHSNVDPSEIRPMSPTSDEDAEKPKIEKDTSLSTDGLNTSVLNNNNNCKMKDKNSEIFSMDSTGKTLLNSPRDRETMLVKDTQQQQEVASPVVVRRKNHHPTRPAARIVKVSPASHEMLLKLFEGVEGSDKGTKKMTAGTGPRKIRPRQDSKLTVATTNKHLIKDPYMINAVTDGLLPMLSLETSKQSTAPTSQLSLVALKAGDKTLTLPSLSVEQNYPAVLSELVKAL